VRVTGTDIVVEVERRGFDVLLLPNAGECAYDRNPHVGGLHRSLDDAKIGGTSGGFVLYFIIFLAVV
jgi:hypothetical protein